MKNWQFDVSKMAKAVSSSKLKKNIQFKVIILGNSGVGKTALIHWYMEKVFSPNEKCTIGATYHSKTLKCEDGEVLLQIWDTAGQERYARLATAYFRKADAVLLCYDVSDVESFEDVENWVSSYSLPEDALMVLVACKSDLEYQRAISSDLGKAKAGALSPDGVHFFETSVKCGFGINEVFDFISFQLVSRKKPMKETETRNLYQRPPSHKSTCTC